MSEPILSISINETREIQKPSRHTVYIINLRGPVRSWSVPHRYNDFCELHKDLSAIQIPLGELPPKSLALFNSNVIEERKSQLAIYLNKILNSVDPTLRRSQAWLNFLNVRDSSATINTVDSKQWIQNYDSLLSFISQIRVCLVKRERLALTGDIAASQSNKLQARKGIKEATATLSELESTLTNCSDLAISERNRRIDMLRNIQNDLAMLSELAESITITKQSDTSNQNQTNQINTFSRDRDLLFSSNSQTSTLPTRSNRKFGVAQETEITRTLDDRGLLQLQNQQMAQQDQVVNSLAEIVRRQKQISLTISDELDSQNALLEQIDDSVNRVGTHLKVADKKLNRIAKG
ncbi:Phox homologous domain-containing protein [Globomyces pollinis-pini]|nr:Phox homologous domain-containing protein [Globomyces pollinis-pini]